MLFASYLETFILLFAYFKSYREVSLSLFLCSVGNYFFLHNVHDMVVAVFEKKPKKVLIASVM